MAYRSQITLTDHDQKLLNELKNLRSGDTTSGVIARAIRIATELEKATKDGKEIIIRDEKKNKETHLAIV